MLRRLVLVALFSIAGSLSAAETLVVKSVPEYLARQEALRQDLVANRRYAHLDFQARQQIFDAQEELQRLLQGKQSIQELDQAERVSVYNADGLIAGILQDAEADRPMCEQVQKLGSRLTSVECISKRQRAQIRANSQDTLLKPRYCTGDHCKSN